MPPESVSRFSDLDLAEPILKAIDKVGYEAPTSIQAAAIPPLLTGSDLLGQAQTGTGKTAAFALPLLSRLDLELHQPQVLVLTPTRELAIQVAEAMQTYARFLDGFRVLPVYGGQDIESQLRRLKRGVHVVVGTPGRVRDHLRRRTLKLDALTALVLDEADEMLRMGFLEEVEQILEHTPAEKQVALFSATLPDAIQRVAKRYLRDPQEIRIETATATVKTVEQRYWRVAGVQKLDALTRILEVEDFDAMLVFVRTKIATTELADRLEARGFACAPLNGDMNQALRERTVDRLRQGKLDIVVATDVAARGLDVDRISHVINFDMPYDVECYVHRIGRTARAGREGKAILFVSPRERRMLYAIERVTRQTIEPMRLPSREDIADRRIAQFKRTISETIESRELGFFERVLDEYRRETGTDASTVAAALAFLVQRERPLSPGRGPSRPAGFDSPGFRSRPEPSRGGRPRAGEPRGPRDDGRRPHHPPREGDPKRSSCDETAAAVVENGRDILSDVVVSQIDIHKRFGGPVPEIASRSHLEVIVPIVEQALEEAGVTLADLDAVAVTNRPGLIGALLVGVAVAKSLALAANKPLIGVDHIHAHIYGSWMESESRLAVPAVALVVSGGHTSLFRLDDALSPVEIGSTADDAAGEAFDKVAAILKLGYPGGPIIDKTARDGDASRFSFKKPLLKPRDPDSFDFSFSGIKTAILYRVTGRNTRHEPIPLNEQNVRDVAASFQKTVVEGLLDATFRAVDKVGAESLVIGGGCAANSRLRERFTEEAARRGIALHLPSLRLSTDNAVMIAGLAHHLLRTRGPDDLSLDAHARQEHQFQ